MKKYLITIICSWLCVASFGQGKTVTFTSSDTAMQRAFIRAKEMALSYKGKPGDAVGDWYESALPPRSAFCMRDASHQSIAAEILGMYAANKNMFTNFVKNISKEKDWCSYWEMNKYGKPAPEDYRNDTAFWYNLNANFDLLAACWKLYLWTGDKTYISDPAFVSFHQKTVHEFIDTWILQADSLLTRPAHPHEAVGYNRKDAFHEYRGLASYSEGVPHVKMGVDLIAAIYRGLMSYASILKLNGDANEAAKYEQKAKQYQQQIEKNWWDENASLYHTHYTEEGAFGKGEGETFLLWFDALADSNRMQKTVAHLLSKDWNVENLSYLPYQLYRRGYNAEAYKYVLRLTDPATERREYPEVSYGVMQAIVQGLMGIEADAPTNTIATFFNGEKEEESTLSDLPVLGGKVTVTHSGFNKTTLTNNGRQPVRWMAKFNGNIARVMVGKESRKAIFKQGANGYPYSFSYVSVTVAPGEKISVSVRD